MTSHVKHTKVNIITRLPLRGNLDITYRCNNNCRHCWLKVFPRSPEIQSELNTDEIKIIIDDAIRLGCREWTISGGEPMLRPDFSEIFDYITSKSSSYSINTNGTLITPEIAELMKRKGRKMIALYGATADVHDHITRNPGSFQATIKGLKLLLEVGADFIIQLIPVKDNYHQFKEMVKLAKSLSSHWRIGVPWQFLSAEEDTKINEEVRFKRFDPMEVIKLDRSQITAEESEREDFSCFSEDDRMFVSCIDYRREFYIDSYGHMTLCRFITDPSLRYDLRKGSFQDCWETFIPSLKDVVKKGKKYRYDFKSCDLKSVCGWCPVYGYFEQKHFSAPIEYLCQVAKENRKIIDDWERNHCRYFKCADITVKIESDLPISENTFHPTFYPFQTDGPGENMIFLQHYFKMPHLNNKDLGTAVYQSRGWEIRKNGSSWKYISFLKDSGKIKKIAIFNKDHTVINVYNDEIKMTEDEDLRSLYHDDVFLTQISLAHILAYRGGFFLHSSGVVIDGRGILFVGDSGAGKSTIRNMALSNNKIKPLCNDRNIVRKQLDEYRIYGTWIYGDLSDVQAVSVPLGAIMFLEQAQENLIILLEDRLEVTKRLLQCVIRPIESIEWWDKTLSIVGAISQEVPCYRLKFDLTGRIIDQLEDTCHWLI